MPALSVNSPFLIFTDRDGQPLEDGYIYIGTAGLPAEANPQAIYWDAALTIPASQPIRTLGGYPMRSGSPASIYVDATDYSVAIKNKNSTLVFQSLNATERINFSLIAGTVPLNQGGTGGTTQAAALLNLGALASDTTALSGAYTVLTADRGKVFNSTGTWTLSLTAAATLGDGFAFGVVNVGVGAITIDPNGGETIDGAATLILAAGKSCFVTCNGSDFRTIGLSSAPTATNDYGLFSKSNPSIVAWSKTGAGTATTSSILYIEVNGSIKTIASGTSITMPALVAGTDYAIWAKTDGTLEATNNHTTPPTANARKVGGFHYAPGGHSGAPGGGNTTPGIWAGSFWDLKWRPVCSDYRGMELFCGVWMDMYLTGVDAITNGSSKYNVTMADGTSPPKVPTIFGGNGTTTYGSYAWFEASELASAFEKRLPTQREFMAHAYGTTEASSIGTDQNSTILNAAYTSAAGLIQATGVMWIWGDDRAGPFASAAWNANTEGRGSEYSAPNAVLLGGDWGDGANAGSRCSAWLYAASVSDGSIGSRFCCDHLQLD